MDTTEIPHIEDSPEEILKKISEGTGNISKETNQTFFPSYSERIQAIELLNQMNKYKRIDEKITENFGL